MANPVVVTTRSMVSKEVYRIKVVTGMHEDAMSRLIKPIYSLYSKQMERRKLTIKRPVKPKMP